MTENNPITEKPWTNHTAYPVVVTYTDGTTQRFECASLIPVPYPTVKWMRKHGKGSKKHNIISIEKEIWNLPKENTPEYRFDITNLNRQIRTYSSLKGQEIDSLVKQANKIIDLKFKNTEHLGLREADRYAIFDIYCENESNEKFIVELQKASFR
jgi:hypothetical protein